MGLTLTLAAAAALGILTLFAVDRMMEAADHPGRPRRVLSTLWLPLCMAVPPLGMVAWADRGAGGSLAGLLGGLSLVPLGALLAVPPMLLARAARGHSDWHADDHVPLAWPAIGTMLLLLAAAGSGPQFLLIVVCAVGLVLIWAETLPRPFEGHGGPGGGWVLICLGLTTALAFVVWSGPHHRGVLVIPLIVTIVIPLLAAWRLGRRSGLLVAGWGAALSPILLLGVTGQDGVRVAVQAAMGGAYLVVGHPSVDGLEILAAPGAGVMVISGMVAGWARAPQGRGRVLASLGWLAGIASVVALIAYL